VHLTQAPSQEKTCSAFALPTPEDVWTGRREPHHLGHVEFQKSHGFGGIDRAMMLSVHGDLRIADAWY